MIQYSLGYVQVHKHFKQNKIIHLSYTKPFLFILFEFFFQTEILQFLSIIKKKSLLFK